MLSYNRWCRARLSCTVYCPGDGTRGWELGFPPHGAGCQPAVGVTWGLSPASLSPHNYIPTAGSTKWGASFINTAEHLLPTGQGDAVRVCSPGAYNLVGGQTDIHSCDRYQRGAQVFPGHLTGARVGLYRVCISHLWESVYFNGWGNMGGQLITSTPFIF